MNRRRFLTAKEVQAMMQAARQGRSNRRKGLLPYPAGLSSRDAHQRTARSALIAILTASMRAASTSVG